MPVTFLKKYWSFHRAIDDYGLAETRELLWKSYQYSATFLLVRAQFFCSVNSPLTDLNS